jgi:putative peptide maturation system protein
MWRENAAPRSARSEAASLQSEFPDIGLELIWQQEKFDASLQYDLLLSDPEGTISLGFSPDGQLPWPLRGVQRWSEDDLLVVNNTTMKVQEAIALLEQVWHEGSILVRLVNACIIREELERDPPAISQGEVQTALDELRRELGLYGAAQTRSWMEERGLSHERMEIWATDRVAFRMIRDKATANVGRAYYEQHRQDFDLVTFLTIRGEGAAGVSIAQNETLVALTRILESVAARGESPAVEIKTLRRWELPLSIRKILDDDLASVHVASDVIIVLSVRATTWDPATLEAVRFAAFEDWLATRRRQANIDWFWGDRETTSAIDIPK